MGSISSICSLYVTQETKSNEITKYEEPTPSKSIQTNSQRLSNYQTKNLIFLINDTLIGVNSICSATLYHKMINGETLLQLLDPLNDFDNNKLKEIIVKVISIVTHYLIICFRQVNYLQVMQQFFFLKNTKKIY